MSVLLDLSLFPLDQGASVSAFVAPVVALLRDSGMPYQLTAMGSLIETPTLAAGLALVEKASALVQKQGSQRVYITLKIDIRDSPMGRLQGKVASVERRLEPIDAPTPPPVDGTDL
jgi:uncharacterized protein (TIGR00106 family)